MIYEYAKWTDAGQHTVNQDSCICIVSEDKKITLNPKQIGFSVTLAAEEGFEPSQTESESAVLPLHNSASHFSDSMDNYRHPASVCQEICCIFSVYSENTSGEDCGRQESLL